MKAEWSKNVLQSDIRTCAAKRFVTGDSVYNRRQNYKNWYGPAKVLGKEGQCVLIRHGGTFYRMYLCHSMKVNSFEVQKMRKTKFNQMR